MRRKEEINNNSGQQRIRQNRVPRRRVNEKLPVRDPVKEKSQNEKQYTLISKRKELKNIQRHQRE